MSTQSFTVADPRSFDGDPFEVAERSVRQVEAVLRVAQQSLSAARLMTRNAQLERELLTDGECDAVSYEDSAEARVIDAITSDIGEARRRLLLIARSSSFNPKKPLGPA